MPEWARSSAQASPNEIVVDGTAADQTLTPKKRDKHNEKSPVPMKDQGLPAIDGAEPAEIEFLLIRIQSRTEGKQRCFRRENEQQSVEATALLNAEGEKFCRCRSSGVAATLMAYS